MNIKHLHSSLFFLVIIMTTILSSGQGLSAAAGTPFAAQAIQLPQPAFAGGPIVQPVTPPPMPTTTPTFIFTYHEKPDVDMAMLRMAAPMITVATTPLLVFSTFGLMIGSLLLAKKIRFDTRNIQKIIDDAYNYDGIFLFKGINPLQKKFSAALAQLKTLAKNPSQKEEIEHSIVLILDGNESRSLLAHVDAIALAIKSLNQHTLWLTQAKDRASKKQDTESITQLDKTLTDVAALMNEIEMLQKIACSSKEYTVALQWRLSGGR